MRGAHDHRVVAFADRIDEFAAQPRRAENRFDDDRAGHEVGRRRAEDVTIGISALRSMCAPTTGRFGQSLGAGGPNVIVAFDFEHRRPASGAR